MLRISTLITLAILATACSTTLDGQRSTHFQDYTPTYADKPVQRESANTGDIILDSWKMEQTPQISLTAQASTTGQAPRKLLSTLDTANYDFRIDVPAGPARLIGSDNKYDYYLGNSSAKLTLNGERYISAGIAVPRFDNEPMIFWRDLDEYRVLLLGKPTSAINYISTEPIYTVNDYKGIGQTITYLGLSQNQLRFVYKEFDGSMIRNAFTQEFVTDYEPGKTVTFKNSSFLVHTADSNHIEFTPLNRFND